MPSLKDLKTRINSVKSTQKITSAMKMVAAAKLRRAQDSAEKGRPYADRMQQIVNSLASKADPTSAPQLLVGNGKDDTHLLVVMSADRGLCGGFNGAITRQTRINTRVPLVIRRDVQRVNTTEVRQPRIGQTIQRRVQVRQRPTHTDGAVGTVSVTRESRRTT